MSKFVEEVDSPYISVLPSEDEDGEDESKAFDANQPRGPDGKWGDTGSGSSTDAKSRDEAERHWAGSLTKAEGDAVQSWTKGNQMEMRLAQAGQRAPAWAKKRARDFSTALDKAPKYQGTAFRGLKWRPDKGNPVEQWQPGATVDVKAWASCSSDLRTATSFLGDERFGAAVLEVRMKNGASIKYGAESSYRHQDEVVLKPGHMRVVSVEERQTDLYDFDFNRYGDHGATPRETRGVKFIVCEEL